MFERPWLFAPEDPVEDPRVDHAAVQTKVVVEGRSDVPDGVELLPHPGRLQGLGVLGSVQTYWTKFQPFQQSMHFKYNIYISWLLHL